MLRFSIFLTSLALSSAEQSVATQTELEDNILSGTTIGLSTDISLISTIAISGVSSLTINGNGRAISGQQTVQCFSISGGSFVGMIDLTITDGYSTVEGGAIRVVGPITTFASINVKYIDSTATGGGGLYLEGYAEITGGFFSGCNGGTSSWGHALRINGGRAILEDFGFTGTVSSGVLPIVEMQNHKRDREP